MAGLELKLGNIAEEARDGFLVARAVGPARPGSAEVLWGRALRNWAVNPVTQDAAPSIHHDFCFIL